MRSPLSQQALRIAKLLAFFFVLYVFVIPQIGGARKALSIIGTLNPWMLGLAVVLEGFSFLAYARLTQLMIPKENRPGLGVTFGTTMASTGVNHVIPGGAAATAAVSTRLLGGAGVPPSELGFALGTQALGSAVVLNIVLWLSLVVSIPSSGFQPLYATAALVGVMVIAIFSAGVTAMLRGRKAFANRVASLLGRLPRVERDGVHRTMLRLSDQLADLISDRRRLWTVLSLAAANWLLDAAALWVMITSFGHRPGVVGLLVAYCLANVMAAIPISPGGLGIIEAVLIPTLIGFGTPRAEASIGVVAYRLINFWLPIPVGAISYFMVARSTSSKTIGGFSDEINRQVELLRSETVVSPRNFPR